MQLSIRGAAEADLDRLVEIHMAAYPDDRSAAQRRARFVESPFGGLETMRVVERGGRIVGQGRGLTLTTYFGGEPVPTVGLASIAVAPEARRSGVGRAVVAALERAGAERGAVLSVLHPFRHAFYGALGYADVAPMRRLEVSPRAVPAAWVEAARQAPLRTIDALDRLMVVELHERCARQHAGWNARPEPFWSRLLLREHLQSALLPGEGFLLFELAQREPHARTTLYVQDLCAPTPRARRLLWGFLGMQVDQVAAIEVELPDDDVTAFALVDIDAGRSGDERVEHAVGTLVAGPMVRVLDVAGALAARGYARDGDASLGVDGAALHVKVRSGRATVAPARSAPRVRLDGRALASIAFGGLGVAAAAELGWVDGAPDAIADADALFRVPPFSTLDRF